MLLSCAFVLCIIAGHLPDLEAEGRRFARHTKVVREIGYRSDSLEFAVDLVFGDERSSREHVRLLLVAVAKGVRVGLEGEVVS
jgi:hypothetical protein